MLARTKFGDVHKNGRENGNGTKGKKYSERGT